MLANVVPLVHNRPAERPLEPQRRLAQLVDLSAQFGNLVTTRGTALDLRQPLFERPEQRADDRSHAADNGFDRFVSNAGRRRLPLLLLFELLDPCRQRFSDAENGGGDLLTKSIGVDVAVRGLEYPR